MHTAQNLGARLIEHERVWHKRRPWTVLLALGLLPVVTLILAGCRRPDCEWSAPVRTWIDDNQNGTWDAAEPLLPGVIATVEGAYTVGMGEARTGEDGQVRLSATLAGCPKDIVLSVSVEAPAGYRLTTQAPLPARETDEGPFLFGFVRLGE